jgi:hypothetical protein
MKCRSVAASKAGAAVALTILAVWPVAQAQTIFATDFNGGAPPQLSGAANSLENVQGFDGLGLAGNSFSGNLLRNSSPGGAGNATVLTLTGLPRHTRVDVDFLLAIIDSWDGADGGWSPDVFNVRMDGKSIFLATFTNVSWDHHHASYPNSATPAGVVLRREVQLFNADPYHITDPAFTDSAYNMGFEPALHGIPHTSENLVLEWFASGRGYQGGTDESWAIDNLRVSVTSAVPEPAAFALMIVGLGVIGVAARRSEGPAAG